MKFKTLADAANYIGVLEDRLNRTEDLLQKLWEASPQAKQERDNQLREAFKKFYMDSGLSHDAAQRLGANAVRQGWSFDQVVADREREVERSERLALQKAEEAAEVARIAEEKELEKAIVSCTNCLKRLFNKGHFRNQPPISDEGKKAYLDHLDSFPQLILADALVVAAITPDELEALRK